MITFLQYAIQIWFDFTEKKTATGKYFSIALYIFRNFTKLLKMYEWMHAQINFEFYLCF